jgi:regulator of protease activity HflC (stomatin/prohibitin superfamily)
MRRTAMRRTWATGLTLALGLHAWVGPSVGAEIHDAARQGEMAEIMRLIEADRAVIELPDTNGRTPLFTAAFAGQSEAVALLVASGATLDAGDRSGRTPLHAAAGKGYEEAAALLLANGAAVNARDIAGGTPLFIAAGEGWVEVAGMLIAAGAGVGAQNDAGATPLHVAAKRGAEELIRLLLENGAVTGVTDAGGLTALDLAIRGDHVEAIALLLAATGVAAPGAAEIEIAWDSDFSRDMEPYMPSAYLAFVIGVLLLALILILAGIKSVPQASQWTIERFGRYTRTLSPGLNLIVPIIDRVGSKVSLREMVLEVPAQHVITADNAAVRCDGVVFHQVVDAAKAAYEVRDLPRAMTNLCMTNIRATIGSMALDAALSQRDEINDRLLHVVDAATNAWGVKVTRIELKDLSPSQDLVEAMGRQMKAEREKRADILTAEGEKQAAILKAEGRKQAAILRAEGRREAAYRDAEAREREAEAEGRATTSVSQAIAVGDVRAVNYFVAQRYVKALEALAMAPSEKVFMMPIEATSVIGSLAGIAALAKGARRGGGTDAT